MTKEEALTIWLPIIADGVEYMPECKEALDMAIEALEQEPRWIPVSERLPEHSGNYLIAIADNDCPTVQFFEISWFYSNTHSWSYLNADVIAWMPLPEPYAESEDNE